MELRIDREFESKIPPLTAEEFQQLEENILADGVVINPIIVWNGVIVDGHNRYRIIERHPEIRYSTHEKQFNDRFAVIAWICRNQLGRRNLNPNKRNILSANNTKLKNSVKAQTISIFKSYAAGCIANALIDRVISVLYVSTTDIVSRMQGNFGADRDNYLKRLIRPDLLIFDDLGVERKTSFGKERVFDVVNRRMLSHKPMIITTNIALSVMQKATDLDDCRIYDRILEMCVPILFDGENFRKGNAVKNLKKAAQILNL